MAHAHLIAGNWKMNGLGADLEELALLANALGGPAMGGPTVLVCPPATLITGALERAGGRFKIGGQNCHHAEKGAFTGEISARMLADAGATHVIVGHSERRTLAGETNSEVLEKARAA
ncbi:MAG: triose-phosphate isomerase, partial [Alphaproteobacteria bacterium]|nr:triose-phosphate isomerase [Alphaproteobacteria bacterium]